MASLWTPDDCAAFLKVDTNELSKIRTRPGGPPFVKIGGRVRYVPGKVTAWLESLEQASTKDAPGHIEQRPLPGGPTLVIDHDLIEAKRG